MDTSQFGLATVGTMVIVSVVFAAFVVLALSAGRQVVHAPYLDRTAKTLWIIALVLVPVIAALIWFAFGRRPHSTY
jgi:hypothetical protein